MCQESRFDPGKNPYNYDPGTGEMTGIDYPGTDTPDVTFSYTRLGRHDEITDGLGKHIFTYNATLQLASEEIADIDESHPALYHKTITRDPDGTGRDGGFHIGAEYDVNYHYSATDGRFERITSPSLPAYGVEYSRLADSNLIEYARYKTDSTTTLVSTQRDYESNRDLIEWVENKVGATVVSRYDYNKPGGELDELGRRTSVVYTGTAFSQDHLFKWGYNAKSELVSSHSYEGNNPGDLGDEITADRRLYAYDQIGNRNDSTEGASTVSYYCPTDLNQYKYVGTTLPDCQTVTATHQYDEDGNLTQDGTFNYTWDAENRLKTATARNPSLNDAKVEFTYDYMGRRVKKVVYYYSGSAWPQDPDVVQRFVYDGWNVVLVLNDWGEPVREFTWGLDLSGTIHGAGGIGGLVSAVEVHDPETSSDDEKFWYFYDANGNVGQILTVEGTNPAYIYRVAQYEYDPYGNTLFIDDHYYDTSGNPVGGACPFGGDNPFRFSTKWFDAETGLGYWGYRYYSPRLGRWISRDPIAELGGLNLYAYVYNAPGLLADYAGLGFWDFIDCMSDCIEDNDPVNYFIGKALLFIGGQLVPKTWVATLAEVVGDVRMAEEIRKSLRIPGVSQYTTIPSALSLKLRAGGRSVLRQLGRYAAPVFIAYGLALATVEAHCAIWCGCNHTYDPATGRLTDILWDTYISSE